MKPLVRGGIAALFLAGGMSQASVVLSNLASTHGEFGVGPSDLDGNLAALVFQTGAGSGWSLEEVTMLLYAQGNVTRTGDLNISLYSVTEAGLPDVQLATDSKSYEATQWMMTGTEVTLSDLTNLSALTLDAETRYALVVGGFDTFTSGSSTYANVLWGGYAYSGTYTETEDGVSTATAQNFSIQDSLYYDGEPGSYFWGQPFVADSQYLASMTFSEVSAVPEPGSLLGLGGLLGGGMLLRRRSKR